MAVVFPAFDGPTKITLEPSPSVPSLSFLVGTLVLICLPSPSSNKPHMRGACYIQGGYADIKLLYYVRSYRASELKQLFLAVNPLSSNANVFCSTEIRVLHSGHKHHKGMQTGGEGLLIRH